MSSLQDQLLKAGIVDEKRAKSIQKEKRKNKVKKAKGQRNIDESKLAAKRALAERAEKDRELAKAQNAEAEKKALQAQIKQMVLLNKIDKGSADTRYQFTHGKKIKAMHVASKLIEPLSDGRLAVVLLNEHYELVPAAIADKIKQRDATAIVSQHQATSQVVDEDDPYAAYQIPDDLDW